MAVSIKGPRITFSAASDNIVFNCPIKKITMLSGPSDYIFIDDTSFYFARGSTIQFPCLNGYPGTNIKAPSNLTSEMVFLIEEIGDVLNPNYFKEDIRNWNGQGTAVAEVSEAPKKAAKSKKAEVTE